jgi:hypothetical protein
MVLLLALSFLRFAFPRHPAKEDPMKAVFLAVSLLLSLSFSVASAQLTKVTVGYSAIAAGQFPAWMATEAGIFRKNGLMCNSFISVGELQR